MVPPGELSSPADEPPGAKEPPVDASPAPADAPALPDPLPPDPGAPVAGASPEESVPQAPDPEPARRGFAGWGQVRGRAQAFLLLHWPAVAVVGLALYLRLANLLPLHYYGDDAEYGIVASYLVQDVRNLAYPDIEGFGARPFVSQPPLVLYLFALAGGILGDVEVGSVAVSVLAGTGTVALVYAIGVLVQGRAAGAVGGLFLAVLPMHVELSRKALLDAGFVFFMTLTLFLFVQWTRSRTDRGALLVGAAAAATALAKLPGVLVLVPLAAGLLWCARGPLSALGRPDEAAEARADLRTLARQTGRAALPLAVGAALYIGLLWYLQATQDLVDKLGWQLGRVGSAEFDSSASAEKPWHWYFTDPQFGVVFQFGWALLALACAGAALLLTVRGSRAPMAARIALVVWPLVVLAFFTLSGRKQGFYLLPLTPGLALLAGVSAGALASRWRPEPILRRLGLQDRRPAMAVLAAALFLVASVPAAIPVQRSMDHIQTDRPWGYGVKEAALFIHDRDPDAAQIGTLLGRYTLHFYNGQRTYFWHLPHTFIEDEIRAGRIEYVVHDTYLGLDHEEEWMLGLVERYGGEVVQEYKVWPDTVTVRVYQLHPPATPSTSNG